MVLHSSTIRKDEVSISLDRAGAGAEMLIFTFSLSAFLTCYVHLGSVSPVIIQLVFFKSAGSSLCLSLLSPCGPACVRAGAQPSSLTRFFKFFFRSLSYIFFWKCWLISLDPLKIFFLNFMFFFHNCYFLFLNLFFVF